MKKPLLIIISLTASFSLISCTHQYQASGSTADMKTAFTFSTYPDYVAAVSSIDQMYKAAPIVLVAKYEKDTKSFVERDLIETESHMKVIKVLKGSLTTSEMEKGIDIAYYGGEMTLDNYLKHTTPVPKKVDSKGIVHSPKQYSKQERETEKVVFKLEKQANKDKDKNSEMMVFLSRNPKTNTYFVMADAYGYRKINKNSEVFNPDTNTYEKVDFYPIN